MLFRSAVIAALLAITPALATLNERSVEEPVELSVRSDMDEDALIFAREFEDQPELERRLFGFLAKLAVKGAVKAGKAIAKNKAHQQANKHHRRDIESEEELFERDLEFDDELFERDFEGEEELELFERDFEDLNELD